MLCYFCETALALAPHVFIILIFGYAGGYI